MEILLTGASGFLGNIIACCLRSQGHCLKTMGRNVSDDFKIDFSKDAPVTFNGSFDVVIHCAGLAHVTPSNSEQRNAFFEINVKGTLNLLGALKILPVLPKSFIFISTVAVYGKETGELIGEETELLAKDPYGLSKIQAEALIQKWCNRNNVVCTILRLPLIAGPNPPGNLKTMINGITKGFYFDIAGGKARKSVVLAEDVAQIIPKAALVGGIYNLTDGYNPAFTELSQLMAKQLFKSKPLNVPKWAAILMSKAGDLLGDKSPINSQKLKKITSNLTFDDSKARRVLNWDPIPVLKGFKIK